MNMTMIKKIGDIFSRKIREICINGKQYQGKEIHIYSDGSFKIDGVNYASQGTTVKITVTGDCDSVSTTSGDIIIQGSSGKTQATSGDITVGNDINGDCMTSSGDVVCKGNIKGSCKTSSGDINYGY